MKHAAGSCAWCKKRKVQQSVKRYKDQPESVSSSSSCVSLEAKHTVFWLDILGAPSVEKEKYVCPRNCLQTEPISCCFNTQKIILIQEHKPAPKRLQWDGGHYEPGTESTICGIDMKLSVYSLNTNRSYQSRRLSPAPRGSPVWCLRCYVWIVKSKTSEDRARLDIALVKKSVQVYAQYIK